MKHNPWGMKGSHCTRRGLAPRRAQLAFTILELLVVIAVIGILSGLIVPAVISARATVQSAVCRSNLRQLGIALSVYMANHNDRFMPIRTSNLSYWFGLRTTSEHSDPASRVFDRTQGYLSPYLDDSRTVGVCPAFGAGARLDGPPVGYAYNHAYLGPTLMYSRVRIPSRLVVLVDSARISSGHPSFDHTPEGSLEENYYLDPYIFPRIHFRHNGTANVLFADWHVSQVVPVDLASGGDGRVGHFCDADNWQEYYIP